MNGGTPWSTFKGERIWPTSSYEFDESKGLYDQDRFLGLGLDEENESDLHEERIKAWTTQVCAELGLRQA